jgi:hypothetical protein
MPAWFLFANLPASKIGPDTYYPYFSGDIYWGGSVPGDSIQPTVTIRDLTGADETIYNILRQYVDEATCEFRRPPSDTPSLANLEKRIAIGEAPLFIATDNGVDPAIDPGLVRLLGYWYGTSERPNARVREVISQDMLGVGYWRFDDTYNYQLGVPANGDQPGDMKWEFGGAVLRAPTEGISEYAVYGSFWVLLPDNDAAGPRIAPPFQDATGASINGGPLVTLAGQDVDLLFLPRGIRPGDVLTVGDTVAFSGHVGPPLDSRVQVTITAPSGTVRSRTWHANRIGWLYDPTFDFVADEAGLWSVDVELLHDRPYTGNGVTPQSHNTGTVMGSGGQYSFYVVEPAATALHLARPAPGVIVWPSWEIEPISIQGLAPPGATAVHYTIYDKGVVMDQGSLTPGSTGAFSLVYDAESLQQDYPMVSLTAHEGWWEGLADEVDIHFFAAGPGWSRAAAVTLVGEEVFVISGPSYSDYLPLLSQP